MHQPEHTIREHLKLCEQVHALLLKENHELKSEGGKTSDEVLAEKRNLLPLLDNSLAELKKLSREDFSPFGQGGEFIRKAQNKLMQIFYIDRENEQLLNRAAQQGGQTILGGKISEIREIQSKMGQKLSGE
jgi:hypothetical protein